MDDRLFDALARGLAGRPTRRQALRLFAATVIGGAVPFRRSAAAADAPTPKSCARQLYTKGKHFSGKPIEADPEFFPSLDKIDECAGKSAITVDVASAYRTEDDQKTLTGKTNETANRSNHLAGHAIDMNPIWTDDKGKAQRCDSKCLAKPDELPKAIKDFNQCLKDAGLRCCGEALDSNGKPDYPHIDDKLNLNNPKKWQERHDALKNSTTCAKCEPCNMGTGLCTSNCAAGKACDASSGICKDNAGCGTNVVVNPNGGAGVCR
ncbi:MAG: DUF882 domain-containing protein [Thermomicrobiales bacterium]